MQPGSASIFQELAKVERDGDNAALCTIIRSRGSTPRHAGSKMLVYSDGSFTGTVGGGEVEARVIREALAAMQDGSPRLLAYDMVDPQQGDPGVCGGQLEVYVEPVLTRPTVLVVGGGHVGKAVARLAHWLDFRVVVSDDRPEFCTPEANPDADAFVVAEMSRIPAEMKISPHTFIVLTTRGVAVDVKGLPELLKTPARYIGVIGSKRRWTVARKAMLDAGVPEEDLQRVHAPMGLELNAETPQEIAVSIMAEIIMLRNGGTGQPMKMDV